MFGSEADRSDHRYCVHRLGGDRSASHPSDSLLRCRAEGGTHVLRGVRRRANPGRRAEGRVRKSRHSPAARPGPDRRPRIPLRLRTAAVRLDDAAGGLPGGYRLHGVATRLLAPGWRRPSQGGDPEAARRPFDHPLAGRRPASRRAASSRSRRAEAIDCGRGGIHRRAGAALQDHRPGRGVQGPNHRRALRQSSPSATPRGSMRTRSTAAGPRPRASPALWWESSSARVGSRSAPPCRFPSGGDRTTLGARSPSPTSCT